MSEIPKWSEHDENEVVYSADQYGQHILHNEVLQPSQLSNDLRAA